MNRFCGSIGRVTRFWKRDANRRHRRYLNRITNSFTLNPELFDEEPFAAPTYASFFSVSTFHHNYSSIHYQRSQVDKVGAAKGSSSNNSGLSVNELVIRLR
jgi:hypothetical protein